MACSKTCLPVSTVSHPIGYLRCNATAQVLRLLSQAFLLNGQAAHAHACVQNVRKLQDPLAETPGLHLTAIQALAQVRPWIVCPGFTMGCTCHC